MATSQGTVLLCIDNDEDLLEFERMFLESVGYTVLTAPNGGKGLELASANLVDVVILDDVMPEMNGHEVAVKMRRLKRQPSIILLAESTDVPQHTLNLVDILIVKQRLGSQLLPAIAQLHRCGWQVPTEYDA